MVLSAITNLILTLDLFFIKSILIDNQIVGYYSAASQIARIPYVFMWGISFAIFPAIAACLNLEKVHDYLSESLRYSLLIVIPFTIILAVTSTPLISLVYSSQYSLGGAPLEILFLGMGLFGLFFMFLMIISSCNRPYLAMGLSLLVLIIDFCANAVLVPAIGMNGGAWATTIASTIGAGLCLFYLSKKYGTFIQCLSVAKIFFATAVMALFMIFMNFQGILLIAGYCIAFGGYFAILCLVHEITPTDLERVRRLVR